MPKLATLSYPLPAEKHSSDCSCEACGKAFDNPVDLTILSSEPLQTYKACPFCFSKVAEESSMEQVRKAIFSANPPDLMGTLETPEESTPEKPETSDGDECPHYLGYLRKRPKNAPIPDSCLTCKKMVQCVL
ncbi:MAG: hypothetical protein NWE78_03600 [Candidatus Bathyarchaeota archaeon]|nr:hypothetical protein [Candidatus Bathyarchaeota archaeon]